MNVLSSDMCISTQGQNKRPCEQMAEAGRTGAHHKIDGIMRKEDYMGTLKQHLKISAKWRCSRDRLSSLPQSTGCQLSQRCAHSAAGDMGSFDYLFKVLVVGDSTVGKTSLLNRYVHDVFGKEYKMTMGVDFALKVVQWSDTEMVRLQLWDIAGKQGACANLISLIQLYGCMENHQSAVNFHRLPHCRNLVLHLLLTYATILQCEKI
ncbi:unnamed protein product [Ranitomeya imitator]|uniref:Uncharacterized protein n=1 Tax=Ranitomeya imitator TaxID=111125 RepID=A0ABN9KNL7_9NEOB|nr:unnamed protein product [Ranitomeya imitator]